MLNVNIEADDLFESVTEQEIMHTWRSIRRTKPMSEDEAWSIIVVGITLDIAFHNTISVRGTEQ